MPQNLFMSVNQNQISDNKNVQSGSYRVIKRYFDIFVSSLALLLLLPLFMLVAAAVKIDSNGPAFYSQTRVGEGGREFKIYKFRSMKQGAEEQLHKLMAQNEADGPVFKIKQDPRLTRVGKFIRKTSIDELPQLFNVLTGDMSLVGPRPALPGEVARYTPYQKQRISVMPGITCIWQISGRSNVSFDEWVELDLKYIRERNMILDLMILILTIPAVITGRGAY